MKKKVTTYDYDFDENEYFIDDFPNDEQYYKNSDFNDIIDDYNQDGVYKVEIHTQESKKFGEYVEVYLDYDQLLQLKSSVDDILFDIEE